MAALLQSLRSCDSFSGLIWVNDAHAQFVYLQDTFYFKSYPLTETAA